MQLASRSMRTPILPCVWALYRSCAVSIGETLVHPFLLSHCCGSPSYQVQEVGRLSTICVVMACL
jgi:hypothetical protein